MALDVDATSIEGVWFSHVPAGGDPLFRPQHPVDGRWHRGLVEGFYVADEEATAWYRALAEAGIPPMRQLPRDLWRFNVEVDHVADLSSPERLERVGLPRPVPDRRQWPSFQTVGDSMLAEAGSGFSTRQRLGWGPSRSVSSARTSFPESAHCRPPHATRSHRCHRVDSALSDLAL